MSFSYDRAAADALSLVRKNGEVLAILTGLFLMVPDFMRNLFLPMPPLTSFDDAGLAPIQAYFIDNSLWLLLLNLPVLLGSAAILNLLLDTQRPSVGQALSTAFMMLPSVFALNLLNQLVIFAGFFVFIIPGLYLIGRLAVAAAWQMANRTMNPLTALSRSLDLTRGQGWTIAGMVILCAVVAAVIARGVGAIVGIVLSFIIPAMSLPAVAAFLSAILSALIVLTLLVLSAAIYRHLIAPSA